MPGPYHLALLGDPVSHSRSPAIHSAALKLAHLEGVYQPIRADRTRLKQAIEELRQGRVQGLNVTMPLKRDARELTESPTPEAEGSGSVNTLRSRQGIIEGHSTDVLAFVQVTAEVFQGHGDVLVMGSGGSAAAALYAFTDRNTALAARDPVKAEALARRFGIETVAFGEPIPGSLVVNATPLGTGGLEMPRGVLESASGLIDLPYGDEPTTTARAAISLGIPVVDGVEFLVRQAVESFQWWTGVPVDFRELMTVARNA